VGAMDPNSAKLWAMAHLGTPMALRVAATLRLADHVVAGVRTVAELAEMCDADADALGRLLRYLVKRGIFTVDADGGLGLTELGDGLRSGHPSRIRTGLDIDGVGRADLAFVGLLHSVRTGEAAYPLQFGRMFWEDLATDPERLAEFDAYMASDMPVRAAEIVEGYDWGSLRHVIDVGGGNGTLLVAMLTRYPSLRGAVVDLPDTAAKARAAMAAAGVADRGTAIDGSFFEPLPTGSDAYVLSSVIHDWSDAPARDILRRCAEAAGQDGRVFVVETIGATGEAPHSGMDLRMLVLYGGKERNLQELTDLAADVGLKVAAVHPAGETAIVELAAP
jgi:O-methyltransferase